MNTLVLFVWTNLVTGLCEWSGDRQTAVNSGANYSTSSVMPEAAAPEPALLPNGIEVPFIIITNHATGVGFEFRVDQYGRLVGGVTNHASPRRRKSAIDADFAALDTMTSNKLTRGERIAVDLQQVDATISNMSVSAATWSNANQRATIAGVKTAVKNLMQATEKVLKELE